MYIKKVIVFDLTNKRTKDVDDVDIFDEGKHVRYFYQREDGHYAHHTADARMYVETIQGNLFLTCSVGCRRTEQMDLVMFRNFMQGLKKVLRSKEVFDLTYKMREFDAIIPKKSNKEPTRGSELIEESNNFYLSSTRSYSKRDYKIVKGVDRYFPIPTLPMQKSRVLVRSEGETPKGTEGITILNDMNSEGKIDSYYFVTTDVFEDIISHFERGKELFKFYEDAKSKKS